MKKEPKRKKQSISKVPRSFAESGRSGTGLKMEKSNRDNVLLSTKKNRYESIILTIMRSVHQSIDLQEVMDSAAKSLRMNIEVVDHVAIFLTEG